jgi:hypothetical protein
MLVLAYHIKFNGNPLNSLEDKYAEELSRFSDGLNGRGTISGRSEIFLFSITPRPALGPTQTFVQWVLGTVYPGVKWPGREPGCSV